MTKHTQRSFGIEAGLRLSTEIVKIAGKEKPRIGGAYLLGPGLRSAIDLQLLSGDVNTDD